MYNFTILNGTCMDLFQAIKKYYNLGKTKTPETNLWCIKLSILMLNRFMVLIIQRRLTGDNKRFIDTNKFMIVIMRIPEWEL